MSQSNLTTDLACTGCSYNLRGLDADGVCPECGQAISVTIQDRTTGRSGWVRTVSRGSLLIGIGLIVSVGALFLLRVWHVSVWLVPVGSIVSAVGSWMFARTGTRAIEPAGGRLLNTALRVTAIATCVFQLQLWLMAEAAIWGIAPMPAGAGLFLPVECLLLAWTAAAILTCQRAARIARRIGDRAGMAQAWLIAVLVPALAILMLGEGTAIVGPSLVRLVSSGIAACVLGIWSGAFFIGHSLILRKSVE